MGRATVVLFVFAGLAQAQSSSRIFARYDRPLRTVRLDLETGTVTRGPAAEQRAITTVLDFTNTDLSGFVGVDTGGGACSWLDAATKGQVTGNASDLVNNVVFAYCSAALSPASGGPGGAVQLGFYEGYTVGGGGPSTTVGLFNVAGLPANTASSSFFGGFRCFFIDMAFANLAAFADGPIGYSWGFADLGTTGVLAATFPFLACVQSCSGTGPDTQGMVDLIDQYCPPGNLSTTFSFGTTPSGSYFTSISMDIREATDVEAVVTSYNGVPGRNGNINVDKLDSNAIVIGETWQVSVTVNDVHGTGFNQLMVLRTRANCISGPKTTSPLGGRPVQILLSGPLFHALYGVHGPIGTINPFPPVQISPSPVFVGVHWASQAVVVGGGFADLTDACCGKVGTVNNVTDPH